MTLEEIIDQAKMLRAKAERARAEFFIFLQHVETQEQEAWKIGGCETFDMFLLSNHICESASYREFIAGMEKLGGEEAALIAGAEATRAARQLQTSEAAIKFVEQCAAFREVHGVAPSAQTAKNYAARLEPKAPAVMRQVTELSKMRATVEKLRADLKTAEAEIKKWKTRAEKAEAALKRKQGNQPRTTD